MGTSGSGSSSAEPEQSWNQVYVHVKMNSSWNDTPCSKNKHVRIREMYNKKNYQISLLMLADVTSPNDFFQQLCNPPFQRTSWEPTRVDELQ